MDALIAGRDYEKQVAVSDDLLIRKDQAIARLEQNQKDFDEAMAGLQSGLDTVKKLNQDMKAKLGLAEQELCSERALRQEADSAKKEAEKAQKKAEETAEQLKKAMEEARKKADDEIRQLKKSLEDVQIKHKTELDTEKQKFQDLLQTELKKQKESHTKELEAALAENTRKVQEEMEQKYSDDVMEELAVHLPAFHPGFDYPGFRAYMDQKMKEDAELLAGLDQVLEGGMPSGDGAKGDSGGADTNK